MMGKSSALQFVHIFACYQKADSIYFAASVALQSLKKSIRPTGENNEVTVPPPPGGFGGLRVMHLRRKDGLLLTCGADGYIHRWRKDMDTQRLEGWKRVGKTVRK